MQDQIDLVFKALAHPERRRILASLHGRSGQSLFEICVTSVAENGQPLSRQTISQHLDVLEQAGLLEITWKGRTNIRPIPSTLVHFGSLSSLRSAAISRKKTEMRIYVTSVFVDDQAKALEFYTNKLGFQLKNDVPAGDHRWLTVVSKEQPDGTELLLEPSDHPAVKPFKEALVADGIPFASFQVDDLNTEFETLKGLGVEFTREPMDAGPVRMAVFDDTCGNLIQLIQMTGQQQ